MSATKEQQQAMLRACGRFIDRELNRRLPVAIDRELNRRAPADPSKSQTMPLRLSSVQKYLSSGKRTIRGIASLPTVDRVGDVVDPRGGSWSLPLPLLWQHKHDTPIGWVREATATAQGVTIVAELAEGIEQADQTWKMIESGLVDSFSIGFKAEDWEPIPTGLRFTKWTLYEVSVVTIPACPGAKITATRAVTGATDGSVKLVQSNGSFVRLVDPARGGQK